MAALQVVVAVLFLIVGTFAQQVPPAISEKITLLTLPNSSRHIDRDRLAYGFWLLAREQNLRPEKLPYIMVIQVPEAAAVRFEYGKHQPHSRGSLADPRLWVLRGMGGWRAQTGGLSRQTPGRAAARVSPPADGRRGASSRQSGGQFGRRGVSTSRRERIINNRKPWRTRRPAMSAPSRKYELRQRRTRKRSMALLRKRYAHAQTEAERDRIVAKLARIRPGASLAELLRPQTSVPAPGAERKAA